MAIANAVLDVIENEKLQEHALEVGSFLMEELENMKFKYNFVGDVRGAGMFIGIDMVTNPITKEPATELADHTVKRCKDAKIIISTEGKYGNVIKFKPPMCFTLSNAKRLVRTLKNIFDEIESYYKTSSASSISSICESWPNSEDEETESE